MNAEFDIRRIIDAMMQAGFYPHPTDRIERIETHISLVFLTGQFAYKVKKPVNFGFLDFTLLERRKFFCEEEVRLNRRLAPDIYLGVRPISLDHQGLHLDGPGEIIEYCIVMRQFDSQGLFSRLIDENRIQLGHMNELAIRLANFHEHIETARDDSVFGNPEEVARPINQNFNILRPRLNSDTLSYRLDQIEHYSTQLLTRSHDRLIDRKRHGHIRECHGDLHLGNIALSNNEIILFDGIEFNESFRWIDTMSDIAFLVMDLEDHRHPHYAAHFLNAYLELCGDYEGLTVLNLYKLYRAMVRAKVAALRLEQELPDAPDYPLLQHQLENYIDLALRFTHQHKPALIITHGVSGSGKSWLSEQLAARIPAIRIRSDLERKRLFSGKGDDLYSVEVTTQVYTRLLELARYILECSYSVIVDATFLDRHWRQMFRQLAERHHSVFHILHTHAELAVLEQRLALRETDKNNISDADRFVLRQQLHRPTELDTDEKSFEIDIDTATTIDIDALIGRLCIKKD